MSWLQWKFRYSAVVFVMALCLAIAAYFLPLSPMILYLFLLVFSSFGLAVFDLRRCTTNWRKPFFAYEQHPHPFTLSQAISHIPTGLKVLFFLVVLYALFNFFTNLYILVQDDVGHVALSIVERASMRLMTGHMLPFAVIPVCFFSGTVGAMEDYLNRQ